MQEYAECTCDELIAWAEAYARRKGINPLNLSVKAKISQSQMSRILNKKLKKWGSSHAELCRYLHRHDRKGKPGAVLRAEISRLCGGDELKLEALGRILSEIKDVRVVKRGSRSKA